MLAYLMYLSAPVPWVISEPELVGRPLVFVAAVLVLFGVFNQFLVIPTIAALPIPWGGLPPDLDDRKGVESRSSRLHQETKRALTFDCPGLGSGLTLDSPRRRLAHPARSTKYRISNCADAAVRLFAQASRCD